MQEAEGKEKSVDLTALLERRESFAGFESDWEGEVVRWSSIAEHKAEQVEGFYV